MLDELQLPINMVSGVYFIQGGEGLIKIGTTHNIKKRFSGLQTANPTPLALIGFIETHLGSKIESKLHTRFYDLRVRGEWFTPHTRLVEFIYNFGRLNTYSWSLEFYLLNGEYPSEEQYENRLAVLQLRTLIATDRATRLEIEAEQLSVQVEVLEAKLKDLWAINNPVI